MNGLCALSTSRNGILKRWQLVRNFLGKFSGKRKFCNEREIPGGGYNIPRDVVHFSWKWNRSFWSNGKRLVFAFINVRSNALHSWKTPPQFLISKSKAIVEVNPSRELRSGDRGGGGWWEREIIYRRGTKAYGEILITEWVWRALR